VKIEYPYFTYVLLFALFKELGTFCTNVPLVAKKNKASWGDFK
jgi:hypothetical protein